MTPKNKIVEQPTRNLLINRNEANKTPERQFFNQGFETPIMKNKHFTEGGANTTNLP